jgi:RNA polymerase sigma factor (TIGR02999 family)
MTRLPVPTLGAPAADEAQRSALDLDRLFPVVYEELRRLAHRRLRAESAGHTLSTTAVVHETYLKLASERANDFVNRAHFFALAARAMRRILIDYARRHGAQKRKAEGQRVSLDALDVADPSSITATQIAERADALIALDIGLERLAAVDQRLARLVEYRFFTGLTEQETAALLEVSPRTVRRDWVRARGWLLNHLTESSIDSVSVTP